MQERNIAVRRLIFFTQAHASIDLELRWLLAHMHRQLLHRHEMRRPPCTPRGRCERDALYGWNEFYAAKQVNGQIRLNTKFYWMGMLRN